MSETLRHVSPEYHTRLRHLAYLLNTVELDTSEIVEDTNFGFDSEGNYHCPSLRLER